MAITGVGLVHVLGTSASLLTGGIQLFRPQRDELHRRVGYVYCGAMVVGNLSALVIY
ncbi:MAG: DUF2306 domain-containing protein, partial [Gemmatimonadetes bacterium]|nr:DUF2306 domain-containing protein [Gemmatimonadota bacterium]